MQPNDNQGPQPDQGQPVAPVLPAQPAQTVQPLQPIQPQQPVQPAPQQQVPTDPAAAVQAALNEPVPTSVPPNSLDSSAPIQQVSDGVSEDIDSETEEDSITWTAQESIHHEKGAVWFILFTVLMLALLGLSIWTQAWSFAVVIVVITVVVFMFSKRPPRELTYALTEDGLSVDGKVRSYDEFKAFGIIRDGEDFSVMLIPVQRLQPGLTMYFPEELGEDIVDILSSHMQMKELKLDAVDRMARFFRL